MDDRNWVGIGNPVAMKFFTNVHFDPTTQTREVIVSQMFASLDDIILKGQQAEELMVLDINLVRDTSSIATFWFSELAYWSTRAAAREQSEKYINEFWYAGVLLVVKLSRPVS